MTVTREELVALWGERGVIYFPDQRFDTVLGPLGPETFPPYGALPVEVPILFTVDVSAPDVQLFSTLMIEVGDGGPGAYIVLGSSPEDPMLLFCLEAATGAVLLLDLETPNLETVNSSFAAFVEFLYRLGQLIATDPGGRERAARAARIRVDLRAVDPAAFAEPESWWSLALDELESTV
ncbi:SUKH-4 family immunity protein [Micromonospora sp. CPCC 205539]|uniref:SUKH-4 family immunity protein n=1 Tax=Micromonospora sp. CPCC 205539 TaxID=3122408 RepID=UPI002FF1613C